MLMFYFDWLINSLFSILLFNLQYKHILQCHENRGDGVAIAVNPEGYQIPTFKTEE